MPRTPKSAAPADNAGEGQPGAAGVYHIDGQPVSQTELKFVFALLGNFAAKPDFDFAKVAAVLGLQKEKSAYERWRLMRIKFGITLPENVAGPAETPTRRTRGKKATPAKTPTTAANNNNGGDDDDDMEEEEENAAEQKPAPAPTPTKLIKLGPVTPAKRGRKPAAARTTTTTTTASAAAGGDVASASAEEEEEVEESPAKKAKGKGKAPTAFAGAATAPTTATTTTTRKVVVVKTKKAPAPSSVLSPAAEMTADEGDAMEE